MMMGRERGRHSNSGGGENVHRRMFGYYLRRIARRDDAAAGAAHSAPADDEAAVVPPPPPRSSSRFRHIMRERLRRERLSQGFADLHALLPPGASSKVSHKLAMRTHRVPASDFSA